MKTRGTGTKNGTTRLAGAVVRVVYYNEDSFFCVLRVRAEGYKQPVSLVGNIAFVAEGEWLQAEGTWVENKVYGRQFQASRLATSAPASIEGMEKYLGSGMIHGIGPTYAKKLVDAFAEAVFDVIESSPERLLEVPGIGPKRVEHIRAAWEEQRIVRDIMTFLHSHGVGTARAARIYKTYGDDAVRLISQNPYRLVQDIRGIGFRSADAIATRLGIDKDAKARIAAGLDHILLESTNAGHCALPAADLMAQTMALLSLEEAQIDDVIEAQVAGGKLVLDHISDTPCLFTAELYKAERQIAQRIRALGEGALPWPDIDPDKALRWVEGQLGFALADSQRQAVRATLTAKLMVITGGPGVGKTTITNAILRILRSKKTDIVLCAPTGRSAKRMQEACGIQAKTIHRLLEVDPVTYSFVRNADFPLTCDMVIVDEFSMVDVSLMQALLAAIPPRAALLILGDIDQLSSVGPGRVLADLIHSNKVPVRRLTEIFRQGAGSQIIRNAHRINTGEMPDFAARDSGSDFFFVPATEPEDALEKIHSMVVERIPQRFKLDPIKDIQVLCPMRKGLIGVDALNIKLQATLNPPGAQRIERFDWSYVVGDKVMQIANDYDKEVYNGDIGYIETLDAEEGSLVVGFDGRAVAYAAADLDALQPAYATTIHKSQGSEYPAVIIPLMRQHYIMLQRSLIYTAVTRGKELVVLIGEERAIQRAVRSVDTGRRWTRLKEWLMAT